MNDKELNEYLNKNLNKTTSFWCGFTLFIIDLITITLCIGLGFFLVNLVNYQSINFKSFINYIIYIPIVLIIFMSVGLYPGIMIPPTEEIKKIFSCTFFSFVAIVISLYVSEKNDYYYSKIIIKDSKDIAIAIAFMISVPIISIVLPAMRDIARHKLSKFKWWGVPSVIYSSNKSAEFIIDKLLKNPYLAYKPTVIIDSTYKKGSSYKNIPILPSSEEILEIIKKHNIKNAIICDYKEDLSTIMVSYRYTITVSKSQTAFTSSQQVKDIAGILAFASIHNLTFKGNLILKRFLDIFVILVFSPIVIPVMLILAFLTKITSKGPIFYGHKRIGKNGKIIKCWKFRSMCVDADKVLEKILAENPQMREEWEKDRKFVNDPRVTKFGKFLRKTSLDELPQLINVLFGEMSLVGPRPVTEPELKKYGKYTDYVLSVTPGLSGMWQISGRSDTGYEERISFDTYYIQNWSIWLDIWILIKTVRVVLLGKGAY